MKVLLFPSRDGGCVAIEARSGHRLLCDGGSGASMATSVAPWLHKLGRRGDGLHLLAVTHAGADALAGVSALLETALAWRVHDFHAQLGDPPALPPSPPVPRIGALWHNGIDAQIGEARAAAQPLLSARARALRASGVPALEALGRDDARIALALPRAARLSRLCAPDMLDIALHAPGAGSTGTSTLALGSLTLTLLGPAEDTIANAQAAWRRWPCEPVVRMGTRAIREHYLRAVQGMAEGRLVNPLDLRDWEGTSACLATRTPSLAPLMLLAEEDGRTVLLSGDADGAQVLRTLRASGRLGDEGLHLHAMTVWTGSGSADASLAMLQAVSADHYLIWGDGTDSLSARDWLEQLKAARSQRTVRRPFTCWMMGNPDADADALAALLPAVGKDGAPGCSVRPLRQSPTLLPVRA
ncbi:hypothetical protein [Cupriavidus sp. AU9028]|uniref:hypothetical protein n=1 Tax=Cupriavidus sp. AU9028 TaxID=2871157 RepID=UPI001C9421EE|nr:hypothetical protein [Cupriavidus sp. AU9028]MBY4895569.1 hypothetical protein [Cupriavidus sp. AU9028]